MPVTSKATTSGTIVIRRESSQRPPIVSPIGIIRAATPDAQAALAMPSNRPATRAERIRAACDIQGLVKRRVWKAIAVVRVDRHGLSWKVEIAARPLQGEIVRDNFLFV